MKEARRKTPEASILLFVYAALLILLMIARIIEYRNLRQTNVTLNELINKSIRRQATLAAILKGSDYIRVNFLSFLFYPDKERKDEALGKIIAEGLNNKNNLAAYQKLVADKEEQMLLNRIQYLNDTNTKYRDGIIQLIKEGKYEKAIESDKNQLIRFYENFQRANITLADFVNIRDAGTIKGMNTRLTGIERLSKLMNLLISILLVVFGIIIWKVIKIIIDKNAQLSESKLKIGSFLERTHEIIVKQDADGRFAYANNNFKDIMEYSNEELLNLTIYDLLAKGSIDEYKKRRQREVELGEVVTKTEIVFISKSGKEILMEGNVFLEYTDGSFSESTGFFKNVTEEKRLQALTVSSEENFRKLFHMAPIPMWTFDAETFRFMQVNEAALKHYGYSEEEFLGKTIMDIRPDDDIPKVRKVVQDLDMTDKISRGVYRHLKKNGALINVEIYSSQLDLDNKKITLVIAIDVTERNRYENKITKAIIKTQEDERYEIGSELHDNVCQLLATAKTSLNMVKPSLPDPTTGLYEQSLEIITQAMEEIRNLSHRLAPAFFNNTTLKEAFESLVRTFNVENSYDVSVYLDKLIDKYPISREMQLNLYRILQEQLRNIIKYAYATRIEVDVLFHNNKLKMRIADNGVGFDVAAKRNGIGLANIKRRAEFFAGRMEINSSPGNGCELIVMFPLAQDNY